MPPYIDAWCALIVAAVHGKYPGIDDQRVVEQVHQLARTMGQGARASGDSFEEDLVGEPAWSQDVRNQAQVLHLVEFRWKTASELPSIAAIHGAVSGEDAASAGLRKNASVADFGGAPPVAPGHLAVALAELELQLQRLSATYANANLPEKSVFLAHVFSSIIRIHPFEDGNGRTARMVVQLLLRRWGMGYLVIPKFRNDADWASSLHDAVHGSADRLARHIRDHLRAG